MGYICEQIHQSPFLHRVYVLVEERVNFIVLNGGSSMGKIRAGWKWDAGNGYEGGNLAQGVRLTFEQQQYDIHFHSTYTWLSG